MEYGIFLEDKYAIKKFTKATSLESFARIFLSSKLNEEGLNYDVEGLTTYLESWLEWSMDTENPCTEYGQIIDTASDTLTYSNVHLQKLVGDVWVPLTSEDKRIFAKAICDRLYLVPEKAEV